ncbi:KAP family P-loop NTPase fold protein [Snodgrassella alvi]|uniref:KAP family P-loop domain protein n=1 Tax=Snodgrassella alvi TaxID=1196083 RepID=A0A2N9X985_9NEIS|nr:P-loop NTPase fold protein [Snodgrassella alvi]PIT41407.1 KAP family P-loop domain protein [Snodgrassella alvi]
MWSDVESEEDYLNFGEVSEIVVDILNSDDMLPISMGVFGNWGAGKSSLLKLIENKIDQEKWIIIKFDAWLYQGYDDARTAILEIIAIQLYKSAQADNNIIEKIKNLLKRVDCFRAMGLLAEGFINIMGFPTFGVIGKAVGSIEGSFDGFQNEEEYEKFKKSNNDLIDNGKKLLKSEQKKTPPQQINEFRAEYDEIISSLKKKIVVVIDNLDRCLPENAIHTLEAIRLFLFLNNTAFIIAADEDMIKSSVTNFFKNLSDRHINDYLDKLIQIPIRVPKAGIREIRAYLYMLYAIDSKLPSEKIILLRDILEADLKKSWQKEPLSRDEALEKIDESNNADLDIAFNRADRISPLLATSPIIQGNPRIVKRLLNIVKMRSKIAKLRSMPLDEAIITKLVIFERCAGIEATETLYNLIDSEHGFPNLIKDLEKTDDQNFNETIFPTSWDQPFIKSFIKNWIKLEPKLGTIDLRAAVYLSRETVPLGIYVARLSSSAKEALNVLLKIKYESLHESIKDILNNLLPEDKISVMEEIIKEIRKVTVWDTQPEGFVGAVILAKHSKDASKLFEKFINEKKNDGISYPWFDNYLTKIANSKVD